MRYKAEYFFGKLTSSTIVYLLLPIMLQRLKQNKKQKTNKKNKSSDYSGIPLFTKIGQKLPTYAQFPCFSSIKASF